MTDEIPSIHIIELDDWTGVYKDGRLVYESHSIHPVTLLYTLGLPYSADYLDGDKEDAFIDEFGGHCPKSLDRYVDFMEDHKWT